jgi:hypothetical protein
VSAADYAAVKEARGIVYSVGSLHNAIIPDYAAGKEVAVDFLRYLATDKANELYIAATLGASLPFKYDCQAKNPALFASLSAFQQDRIAYFNDPALPIIDLPSLTSFPLVRFGGLAAFSAFGSVPVEFTSGGNKGSYSSAAERIFRTEIQYWTENNNSRWKAALSNAGF